MADDNVRLTLLEDRFNKVEDAIISLDNTSKNILILMTKQESHTEYTHAALERAFTSIKYVSDDIETIKEKSGAWDRASKFVDMTMIGICACVGISLIGLVIVKVV